MRAFLLLIHHMYVVYGTGRRVGDCVLRFVPVCLTYYLEMPPGTPLVGSAIFLNSLACGLVIDTLLIVNNYRDIDNDRRAGKKTLVVRIGAKASERLYLILGFAACILGLGLFYYRCIWAAFLPFIYLVMHIHTYREMVRIRKGTELNRVLGMTARNMFFMVCCNLSD